VIRADDGKRLIWEPRRLRELVSPEGGSADLVAVSISPSGGRRRGRGISEAIRPGEARLAPPPTLTAAVELILSAAAPADGADVGTRSAERARPSKVHT
jgi:hypothetical protein